MNPKRLDEIEHNLADHYSYRGKRGELPGIERAKDDVRTLLKEMRRQNDVVATAWALAECNCEMHRKELHEALMKLDPWRYNAMDSSNETIGV